ncbi:bifunctional diguanylate cyclase/phosphodiesterase [Sulfurimonas sp.]|uniref:bifunctional diguanylate cyclase/phosphodiesterase n=1 Tax=Sulfurimonas sp. TaxID=2022749 RepID=UPI00262A13EC|nr:bifunctional diguanylate cyclase/phosphodiesterase [Sulfurimonas sp.]
MKDEIIQDFNRDPLTHLYNRAKFNEDCAARDENTLILIDIVGFSKINENYGYKIADSVLIEFGAFLQIMYHDDYTIYHLGNDLFGLIPHLNAVDNIFKRVKAIRSDILKIKIITNNFNNSVAISIGVAYQNEHNLLRKAELALKEARNSGINKIKYYSDDLKILKKIENTNKWVPIIQEQIEKESFLVYYQPVYNLRTYTIDKYETLIRIKHKGQIYSPGLFIQAAYDAGFMYEIFKFMFISACKKVNKKNVKLSVNIGTQELERDDLYDFIKINIEKYGIATNKLSVEILEYNSIAKNSAIHENILKIYKLGIAIIIDDFGVNCSNFSQLQNLPISIIKIDGSFIENIASSKESQIIVKTIQTYAREKNIKLVAEYVASKEALSKVMELNIEYGQGNYLGAAQEQIDEFYL